MQRERAVQMTPDEKVNMTLERADEPAKKWDGGKIPLQLLPTTALEEVAEVLDFGANKYGPHNWKAGMSWSRLIGACLRHIFRWMRGEKADPETGRHPLAHACCCLLFLIDYALRGVGTDDR